MNKTAAAAGSASITTIVILFAMHGKGLGEALMGLWLVLAAFTKDAPLGLVSFLLAVFLAALSQPFLRRWLPAMPCHLSREFTIETAALAIGVAVMWTQLGTLQGLMVGILAGLLAPYVQKGLAALWALGARALGVVPAPAAGDKP